MVLALFFSGVCVVQLSWPGHAVGALLFSCSPDNDLFRIPSASPLEVRRWGEPRSALDAARKGASFLVLADSYPSNTGTLAPEFFTAAARKRLRIYLKYPGFLPGMATGKPPPVIWERAAVTSDFSAGSFRALVFFRPRTARSRP